MLRRGNRRWGGGKGIQERDFRRDMAISITVIFNAVMMVFDDAAE
jgi:hypothetical protein